MYQCEKIINTINDATNTHHAIETPNIQASRVIETTPNLGLDQIVKRSEAHRAGVQSTGQVRWCTA
jgi:hypothetical protein